MTLPDELRLVDELPTVDEYVRLRDVAGLSPRPHEAVATGLPGTWAACVVRAEDGTAVGMGRVVGDGGCCFLLVDMAVDPGRQRQGIGTAVLDHLMGELEARAPTGAHITLLADPPARELYPRYGFQPTAPHSIGMHRLVG